VVGGGLQHRGDPAGRGRAGLGGIILVPAVGAILTSASTVIVAINARLLRRTGL